MKVKEILLELREILDRSTYGAWVHALTKKVYPVEKFGHVSFLKKYLKQKVNIHHYGENELYNLGFQEHLVRIVHDHRDILSVEGVASDIARISNTILATALQPDVNYVYVDKLSTPTSNSPGSKSFRMPVQRQELRYYLRGE